MFSVIIYFSFSGIDKLFEQVIDSLKKLAELLSDFNVKKNAKTASKINKNKFVNRSHFSLTFFLFNQHFFTYVFHQHIHFDLVDSIKLRELRGTPSTCILQGNSQSTFIYTFYYYIRIQ